MDLAPIITDEEELWELTSSPNKFSWTNRLACVETLATLCIEQECKFEKAIRSIHLNRYCSNEDKMLIKHSVQLKRDVAKKVKDILCERDTADVGDLVKVPKYVPAHPKLGGYKREGNAFVEAIVVEVRRSSLGYHYIVKRSKDNMLQEGNGHMIKRIVCKANKT